MESEDAAAFKAIAQALTRNAPAGWKRLDIEGEMQDDYAGFDCYVLTANGERKRFSQGMDAADEMFVAFEQVRNRMKKASGHAWSKVTFSLEMSGRFKVDYAYDRGGAA
jgi:hypothetical protein